MINAAERHVDRGNVGTRPGSRVGSPVAANVVRVVAAMLASATLTFLVAGAAAAQAPDRAPDQARANAEALRELPADAVTRLPRSDATDDPDTSPVWRKVRVSLFQDRPITTDSTDVVVLESPARADDAAVVPIAIRARFDQSEVRYIERLYLIVDRNPSPISAIFHLTTLSGRADIETRIRVEDYSFIRAVAELNDGSLHMATRFIKASGGCSAPAGRDMAQAMANLGRWRMRVEGQPEAGRPALAQLMISHPNEAGLAMDQVSRTYASPHFVRQVEVTYGGKPVLTADIDFSISENPNFRFYFTPRDDEGQLAVHFVDNQDLAFDGAIVVPGAGVAAASTGARAGQ